MTDCQDDAFWQWRVLKEEKDYIDGQARYESTKQRKQFTLGTLGVPVPVHQLPPRPQTGLVGAGMRVAATRNRSASGAQRGSPASYAGPFRGGAAGSGASGTGTGSRSVVSSRPSARSQATNKSRRSQARGAHGTEYSYPATPNFSEPGTEADSEVLRRLDNLEKALETEKKRREAAEKQLIEIATVSMSDQRSATGGSQARGGLSEFGREEEKKPGGKASGKYNPKFKPSEPTIGINC